MQNEFKELWFNHCGYVPHKRQDKYHESKARFKVVDAGRRWGKSLSASKETEPILQQKDTKTWIVAPTYDLTDKVFREVWKELVIVQQFPVRRKSQRERFNEFEWGATIEGKSADSPDSLVGEGLDKLILDEAAKIKKRIWEQYLRPTLSDREGSADFISTPEGFNWFYDLFQRGKDPDHPEWWSIQSPTWDNPFISKKDIAEAKATLTKETFDQEYGAKFTSFAGQVYPFDRNAHVKKLPYIKGWDTYCSIDFGYRMPSVGWYQTANVEGRDEVHLIDEISHMTDIKTQELANMILSRGYPNVTYFGDPAGGGVQAQSGIGDIEIFKNSDIYVKYKTDKVSKNIPAGVDLVRSFFEDSNGDARFFVSDKCIGHISDYEGYRYPEKKEDMVLKDEPKKDGYFDHGCDETRYFFINKYPIRNDYVGYREL